MDDRKRKGLTWVLAFVIAAAVFGCGVAYGLSLPFHKGSDYLLSEMTRRDMDLAPFQEYLQTQAAVLVLPLDGESAVTDDAPAIRIDLNSAGKEELMRLPGIGEVRAQAILDFRSAYGHFNEPSDLLLIDGFSEKLVDELTPYLTVR